MRTLLLITLLSLVMAGCQSSPQNNYYLLSALPLATPSSDEVELFIGISPVEIADYLNRLNLAFQQENGKLVIQENQYWAEPLDKGIARIIGLNLHRLKPNRSIIQQPTQSPAKAQVNLHIQIHELSHLNTTAHINASWNLIDNSDNRLVVLKTFVRSIPAQADNGSMVQAYSDLLVEMATEIDQALNNL